MIVLLVLLLASVPALAQNTLTGTVSANTLNVRSAPNVDGERLGQLTNGAAVIVEGRSAAGDWFLVTAQGQGLRGWVAAGFIRLSRPVRIMEAIPLSNETVTSGAAPAPAAGANPAVSNPAPAPLPDAPPPERTDYPAIYLPGGVLANARAIYARGRANGNHPFSMIKIGESNLAETVFLCNFQWGEYELGDYGYLQYVIDGLRSTDSLCRFHFTAQKGFSTAGVLDPMFATHDFCEPNESPLACEYRRSKPSYAVIYIGMADHGQLTPQQYRANLTTIVQQLSAWGVVPILTTYPTSDKFTDGKPQEYNEIVRAVARAQRVPMMDVRAAIYDYPNHGTGTDGYHLSVRTTSFTSFNGDHLKFGRTYYEWLTLSLLNDLHNQLNS